MSELRTIKEAILGHKQQSLYANKLVHSHIYPKTTSNSPCMDDLKIQQLKFEQELFKAPDLQKESSFYNVSNAKNDIPSRKDIDYHLKQKLAPTNNISHPEVQAYFKKISDPLHLHDISFPNVMRLSSNLPEETVYFVKAQMRKN